MSNLSVCSEGKSVFFDINTSLKYFCYNMYELQSGNAIYFVYAVNCVRIKVNHMNRAHNIRLAPVLKTIFHQCAISNTCS